MTEYLIPLDMMTPEQRDFIFHRRITTLEDSMAQLKELADRLQAAYTKELKDIQTRIDEVRAGLEDRAVNAEEARDQAVQDLEQLKNDTNEALPVLESLVQEMAANDLPEAEQPPAEAPPAPTEPAPTEPAPGETAPTEPAPGETAPGETGGVPGDGGELVADQPGTDAGTGGGGQATPGAGDQPPTDGEWRV